MIEQIDLIKVQELIDMLDVFQKEYVYKVLERRDQMWDKRRGDFKDPKEAAIYEDTRIKGEFLVSLHGLMKQLASTMSISMSAIDEYIGVVDRMKVVDDGEFRATLFEEQRKELMRITDVFRKISDYNTATYESPTK